MGNGLSPLNARALAFLSFAALALLTGCAQEPLSTIAWSPSGARVAYLDSGVPTVFDVKRSSISRLAGGPYAGLVWSPVDEAVAVSSGNTVELFRETEQGFARAASYAVGTATGGLSAMMWHPSGKKLLVARLEEDNGATWEIDLASNTVSRAMPGLGFYGPGGRWLLWWSASALGRRAKVDVFDRQAPDGASLKLPPGTRAGLESEDLHLLSGSIEGAAPQPLCWLSGADAGPSELYCLDDNAALKRLASLPPGTGSRVFPNRDRTLLAVLTLDAGKPSLTIYDAAGKARADGKDFLAAIAAARPDLAGKNPDTLRVSLLAWSPDGEWLAWVVEGRLCLWNWRANKTRLPRA
jgi:WD40 repeat protein